MSNGRIVILYTGIEHVFRSTYFRDVRRVLTEPILAQFENHWHQENH